MEQSLADNKPRALIQMATGSGKTFTAVNLAYRLVKFAKARRVLFLVDRKNLGQQALTEFQSFETPDDGRKFSELYNVQHMTTNYIDPNSRVCITTIQRLYAMLRNDELDEEADSLSGFEAEEKGLLEQKPKEVSYTPHVPIETFDFIVIDECHRSIYNLWRQVLEYFDAYLIGLTATPGKQTIGFFFENRVMQYAHQEAVADNINVNGDVYTIRTRITQAGSTVEAGFYVGQMDCSNRVKDQVLLDEDFAYVATQVGRDVVTPSQIRLVITTFRHKTLPEAFRDRQYVPKTLIFARDDNHAEEIVGIVKEVFNEGDAFCEKMTYRSGRKPEEILADFRNAHDPRIAVTVDMIATGTDVKAIEVLLFLRLVKSLGYFEQMRGRGVRVIKAEDLQRVNDPRAIKDRFLIVDAVGVSTYEQVDTTKTLNRRLPVPLPKLLEAMAYGNREPAVITTVAGRLARLQQKMEEADHTAVQEHNNGQSLSATNPFAAGCRGRGTGRRCYPG